MVASDYRLRQLYNTPYFQKFPSPSRSSYRTNTLTLSLWTRTLSENYILVSLRVISNASIVTQASRGWICGVQDMASSSWLRSYTKVCAEYALCQSLSVLFVARACTRRCLAVSCRAVESREAGCQDLSLSLSLIRTSTRILRNAREQDEYYLIQHLACG